MATPTLSAKRRECAPDCHSWDYRRVDQRGKPTCRACGTPKWRRSPDPNMLAAPLLADMPDTIEATSTDYVVRSWWSWTGHPNKRDVVAMLRGWLPEWEVGHRVSLWDAAWPLAEPHGLLDSLQRAAFLSARDSHLSETVVLVRGWLGWVQRAERLRAAFLRSMGVS